MTFRFLWVNKGELWSFKCQALFWQQHRKNWIIDSRRMFFWRNMFLVFFLLLFVTGKTLVCWSRWSMRRSWEKLIFLNIVTYFQYVESHYCSRSNIIVRETTNIKGGGEVCPPLEKSGIVTSKCSRAQDVCVRNNKELSSAVTADVWTVQSQMRIFSVQWINMKHRLE